MSPAAELRWLCRLIDDYLRPYTESWASVSISKEKEKEILIASSQVVTKIQLRIREFDSRAEMKRAPDEERLCGSNQHSSVDQCLPRIITEMMVLLTVKSEFVQHVAVNALSLTSRFVHTTGNNWVRFIHFLCCWLEMAITKMISCSSGPSSGTENGKFDSSDVEFLTQYGTKDFDWSTVAGVVRVMRVICKYLEEEDYDDGLVQVYHDSVNSCLLKMPWDLLDKFWSCEFGSMKNNSSINQLHLNKFSIMEPVMICLGTFLQFLCSLVDRNDLVETDCDSIDKHPLFITVVNLVPRLAKWCLRKQEHNAERCITNYLNHKLLILMIRLGSLTGLDCRIPFSWIELLHNYFEEFLQQPLTQFHSDQINCLEGSPFLVSLSDGEACLTHSGHLQRQSVYLLLACSFSLISQRGENANHCNCSTLSSCFTTNPDSEHDRFCMKKGFLELYKWIQRHLPTAISTNHDNFLEICMDFMSSFLQLYLREDDLLFDVLLLLCSISSCLQQQSERKDAAYQDVMKDFPFALCLHLICNSWKLFVEFPLFGEFLDQSPCKRRKIVGDGLQLLADGIPTSVDNSGSTMLLIKNYKEDSGCGFKRYNIKPFKKAAECLLSLNNSVYNLHQKKLFPYNPEVLLKRLRRFQEFCSQEKGSHGLKTE
ncbi:Protein Line [Vigna unguiculata]|uniref:Protein Line n=1 Tax=Vigna unguiculata TaxID=3917 RepID=A0A4D6KY66_VIGUN|nr:Protein Line [Vigna unguiculata]